MKPLEDDKAHELLAIFSYILNSTSTSQNTNEGVLLSMCQNRIFMNIWNLIIS